MKLLCVIFVACLLTVSEDHVVSNGMMRVEGKGRGPVQMVIVVRNVLPCGLAEITSGWADGTASTLYRKYAWKH
jgi:hypothetical protein